jgi:hypothetical protein
MRTTPSFWSRHRSALLLGAAGCIACCAVPLAALVIGGGAASTIAIVAEPISGVLLAASVVLGVGLYVRHRRARSKLAGCGCAPTRRTLFSSPEPHADAPIACTFDVSDGTTVQDQISGYRKAFDHLVSSQRTSTGFRWTFANAPGVEPLLRKLAEREAACCSFMKFDLTSTDTEIVWTTRADGRAQSFIDEFFHIPDRLREEPRSGHDAVHLKVRAERAGLVFTGDRPR